MKDSLVIVAVVGALLGGACNEPILPAGPSSSVPPGKLSLTSQSVPFKGTLRGTQTVAPLEPPFRAVNGSGGGTATHLGQYTVVFPHTVNTDTHIGQGTFTFTSADGATLRASFTGYAQGAPPIVSIEEHATITGGTGRFSDATGSFTVRRQFNQATGVTEGSFDGSISGAGD